MLAAIWDAREKDMGKAVCGSSSRSSTQEVTSDISSYAGLWEEESQTAFPMSLQLTNSRYDFALTQ